MKIERTHLFIALAFFAIGALCGFFTGKSIYQPTYGEKTARDTVIVRDTVFDYHPSPADSARVRYVTRYLQKVLTDTVVKTDVITCNDSVLVEVPITSKHYGSKDYDAWVSGFEPSLDSIKVYKETQYITETITRTVKDNKHFFVDVSGGCEKNFKTAGVTPFAEFGATFKPSRWSIRVTGGYQHVSGTGEPYARFKLSYDIIAF